MTSGDVVRGQIWSADIGSREPERLVIVSNDSRNRHLAEVLGVRLTTSPKPDVPSIAVFAPGEIDRARTRALADDLFLIPRDRLVRQLGILSPTQMGRLEEALRAALDL